MTKNKIKLFKILNIVLVFGVCFTLTKNLNQVKAKIKSLTQEKLNEEKEIEEFELKQIVKRDNAKFLVYEHKLSGALAVVHNMHHTNFSGIYFASLEKNSLTKNFSLKQMLETKLEEKFQDLKKYKQDYYSEIIKFENDIDVLKINLNFKEKNFINFLLNELKNPSFLKEENLTKTFKDKIKLNLSDKFRFFKKISPKVEIEDLETFKKLETRFKWIYNFQTKNIFDEVDNLKIEDLKKYFKKMVNPQNTLIVLASSINKNYKEILKNLSNNYFNYFKKTNEHNNFKHKVEKEAFRKIKTSPLTVIDFQNKKEHIKKPKFMARLYYDISNLTNEEKFYLSLNSYYFKKLVRNCLKNLGYYCCLNYNEKEGFVGLYDTIIFNNLIFIDLFGDDEKLFKKETLIKNFKKIIKEFIKKAKNLNEEKLKKLTSLELIENAFPKSDDTVANFRFSNFYGIDKYIIESFNLTKNPFSPKFFKISKNGELKDIRDKKDFFEKFKNFEKNFNFFLKNEPKYIDVLAVNNEIKDKEKFNVSVYKTPLEFPKKQNTRGFYCKENVVELMAKNIIFENFLKDNLLEKALIFSVNNYELTLFSPESNKKEVEKYIFGEFKEKFKKFKPTKKDVEYAKKQMLEELNFQTKNTISYINFTENFLKNEKRIENVAKQNKLNVNLFLNTLNSQLKSQEKYLNKVMKEKNNKKSEQIKQTKKDIKEYKQKIKELKENKNNLDFFKKQIKERNKEYVKNSKNYLKENEKSLKVFDKIEFEDILNLFKKIKFENISNLEKIN